jgi:antitoxin PrlF
MQATLTSKGQITLPKKLRELMHLRSGDKVEFVVDGDGNVMVIPMTSPITRLKGMVPPPEKAVSLEDMEEAIAEGARDT